MRQSSSNSVTIGASRTARGLRGSLATSACALALLQTFNGAVHASGPSGASVVAGQASVSSPSATSTVINQTTNRAVINWQSFSVPTDSSVVFQQPSSTSITLNRVIGTGASDVEGSLFANGQVWLINGNGILFGRGAQVDVGSLIATTADIRDAAFMSGNYDFSGASSNPNAGVQNLGTISTSSGGASILAGAYVSNAGLVKANLGKVVLAGTQTFRVDFDGDNLLYFAVGAPVARAPLDGNGNPRPALVSNSGTISAPGGQVTMTARAASAIVSNVINTTGLVQATSASIQNGEVVLDGGDGNVSVSGTVTAGGQTGGSVTVTGNNVQIADATIDASGSNGGGTIAIGSSKASQVTVDANSRLNASASVSGNAGAIVIDAQQTAFHGSASATGGASGGNGGAIETSGSTLDVSGARIDTSAHEGTTGTWTLDPENVTISSAPTSGALNAAGSFTANADNSNVNTSDLEAALATTNIVVSTGNVGSQAGDITVTAPISWSAATTLTLDAYHSINVNSAVTIAGAGGLSLITNDGGSGGALSFNGGNVAFTDIVGGTPQGSLTINSAGYTLLGTMAAVQAVNGNLAGNYALADSIDASTTPNWTPIGTDGAGNKVGGGFTGNFEGLGNTISNLTIHTPTLSNVGLFGFIGTAGSVRDLILANANVGGADNVGALAGENDGTVVDDNSSGTVAAIDYTDNGGNGSAAGGLVGVNTNLVDSSSSSASVTGLDLLGGLAGSSSGFQSGVRPTITNSFATGNVSGVDDANEVANGTGSIFVGGLVGQAGTPNIGGVLSTTPLLVNDHASGIVTGDYLVGGLAGNVNSGVVNDSYATGSVSATIDPLDPTQAHVPSGNGAGGLIGYVGDQGAVGTQIIGSWASGSVVGNFAVGGLVGRLKGGDSITLSYATGSVAAIGNLPDSIGGLVGSSFGAISNSYSTGPVDGAGATDVGGFVGEMSWIQTNASNSIFNNSSSSITNSWSASSVNGPGGAFVGTIQTGASAAGIATPSIISGYFDTGTDGGLSGVGGGDTSAASVTGLTTPQMMNSASFSFASSFGGLGSGQTWVIVDQDGTIDNSGGAAGATRPILLSEYSTTIVNAHQLQLMELNPAANYSVAGGIDASGTGSGNDVWGNNGFVPVGGNGASAFTGIFEGEGNTIANLSIGDPVANAYVGLFGDIGQGGSAANLTLLDPRVSAGNSALAGALAGLARNVSNVSVIGANGMVSGGTASVVGGAVGELDANGSMVGSSAGIHVSAGDADGSGYQSTAGGLIGLIAGHATVSGSSASGDVSGGTLAILGGLAGEAALGATVSNVSASANVAGGVSATAGGLIGILSTSASLSSVNATGNVSIAANTSTSPVLSDPIGSAGSGSAGGLVGVAITGSTITKADATGAVSGAGNTNVGGLIGYLDSGTLTYANATGAVAGGGTAGGLVGHDSGLISYAYATGNVSGAIAGGLVGLADGQSIDHAYATGDVDGTVDAGGFAGTASVAIGDAYATGGVTSPLGVSGGFVANLESGGSVTNAYEHGGVSGNAQSGAFAGTVGGTLTDVYFDTTRSPGLVGIGSGSATATGLTDLQMTNVSNFAFSDGFGGLGSGAGWVIVDADGSIDNAGGAAGGTSPMLLAEYSTSIINAHQLQLMALDPTASYTLGLNVDASATGNGHDVWTGAGFIPVGGNGGAFFTGQLDGRGYTIGGLVIDDQTVSTNSVTINSITYQLSTAAGLFGVIGSGGSVSNLNVVDAQVTNLIATTGHGGGVGALAGVSFGTITNVFTSGTVSAAGTSSSSGVPEMAGGLVGGLVNGAAVAHSFSSANVTAGDNADTGGLVGALVQGATVTGSFATGNVTGGVGAQVGGLVGRADDPGNDGVVSIIESSGATGSVSGGDNSSVGGLIGTAKAATIDHAYATGAASTGSGGSAGGFAGDVGAIGSVDESYSKGSVSGGSGSTTGAFAGSNTGHIGQTTAVYYDTDATPGLPAVGAQNGTVNATGLTTSQMATTSSYAWTDFGTSAGGIGCGSGGACWVIVDGDESFNNAGSAVGGTTPMLLSEYSQSIATAHQLQLMALDPAANYTLIGNIDATSTAKGADVWTSAGLVPVGGNAEPLFSGQFEGNGFAVDGLFIDDTTQSTTTLTSGGATVTVHAAAGLFGVVGPTAVIRDVALTNVNITNGNVDGVTGALAGGDQGTLMNVSSTGSVTGVGGDSNNNTLVGGVVGGVLAGTVANSSSSAAVTAGDIADAGGLVGGMAHGATIIGSFATGSVTAGNEGSVGGLLGYAGDVDGNNGNGNGQAGVVGSSVLSSWASGNVTGGQNTDVGGLVGQLKVGQIKRSYATGNVSGAAGSHDGGLVGLNQASITKAYATGTVTGSGSLTEVGGFVGENQGGIDHGYATGSVIAVNSAQAAGGFVGINYGHVDESYSKGPVGGSASFLGAFSGQNSGALGHNTADYFDSDITGALPGDGDNNVNGTLTGLTTPQMETASSFSWTDFGTTPGSGSHNGGGWVIVDADGSLNNANGAAGGATPMLLSEYSTTVSNAHQLQLMALDPAANYVLAANIDASRTSGGSDVWGAGGFVPVGGNNAGADFAGIFNGNGYAIDGLTINFSTTVPTYVGPSAGSYPGLNLNGAVGLFGVLGTAGLIENVGLTNALVTGGDLMSVGALAGASTGTIVNAYSSGSVTTGNGISSSVANANETAAAGGLVGTILGSALISDSWSSATVTGGNSSAGGGLLGSAVFGGSVVNSHATGGVVTGNNTIAGNEGSSSGGLIGALYDDVGILGQQTFVENSYASGNASAGSGGSTFAGGLIGDDGGGAFIDNSHATGNATVGAGGSFAGTTYYSAAGGLTGASYTQAGNGLSDTIVDSTATGTATTTGANAFAGGLAGIDAGSIVNGEASGTVSSGILAGGLVGYEASTGSIGSSSASGPVSGTYGIGGLVGQMALGAQITNSSATGSASGSQDVGGLVGQMLGGSITGANASGTVGGTTSVGGLVGEVDAGSITASSAIGNVFGTTDIGGLAGLVAANTASGTSATVSQSNAGGTVTGSTDIGGLVGHNSDGGTVTGSSASGDVSGTSSTASDNIGGLVGLNDGAISLSSTGSSQTVTGNTVGGFVGDNTGSIDTSESSATVNGGLNAANAGGLVGSNESSGTIDETGAAGNVQATGSADVGGLAGYNAGGITRSFALGPVSGGNAYAGGLVGGNVGTISEAYAIGLISVSGSTSNAGGLVGNNASSATIAQTYSTGSVSGPSGAVIGGLVGKNDAIASAITASYFDTLTSGLTTAIGGGAGASGAGVTGETTAQLQAALPADFTAADWKIVAGESYPFLAWQLPSGTPDVVSGIAFSDTGSTADGAGVIVSLLSGSTNENALTGANGYYYFLLAPGTISGSGGKVLAYTQGANGGVTFADNAVAPESGFDIWGGTLREFTSDTNYSTLASNLVNQAGSSGAADEVASLANEAAFVSGSGFTLDQSISRTGSVNIQSSGDLTVALGTTVASGAGGDAVVLSTQGNFINLAGANAINLSGNGARWLVFSDAPSGDTFGGLDSGNTAVWDTGYTTVIAQSGDRYVFALQPTISVTSTDVEKTYGQDVTTTVAASYVVSGVQGGVSGAFLGDTAAAVYSGTPSVTSAGSAAGANVNGGPYAITVGSGTFSVGDGYTVDLVSSGNLTVDPATLTYLATAANRTYGSANPAFSGTVTGFVNSDTQLSATTGALSFTSPATPSDNVGSYAVNGSGLTANNGNYTFVQAAANATALTVDPATLTYVADAANRTYGSANPVFTGTVTGFVNSDTQLSATTGTLSFASPATPSDNVGSYAVNGSGLTANNGNYKFVQAAANATALTIAPAPLTYVANAANRTYGAANPALTGTVTGFVNSDTQLSATTGTLSFTTSATSSSDVGQYAIDGSGLSLTTANYVLSQAPANATALTITQAAVTETLIGTVEKQFDGTTAATLTAANYAPLAGVIGNDNVSLASMPTQGTYDTPDVGTGKVVTVAGLTLTGAKAFDYAFSGTASGIVGIIDNAPANNSVLSTFVAQPPSNTPSGTNNPPPEQPEPDNTTTGTQSPSGPSSSGGSPQPGASSVTVNVGNGGTPTPSNESTGPIEDMIDQGGGSADDSDEPASQGAATIIAQSLDPNNGSNKGGSQGSNGTVVIINGLLSEVVQTANGPPANGIPPADQVFSSWGNEALW